MKFRTKFVILFVSFILIQGIFVGYFSYKYSENMTLNDKKNSIGNMVNLIDININTKIRFINEVVDDLAEQDIINILNNRNEEKLEFWLKSTGEYLNKIVGNINGVMIISDNDVFYNNIKSDSINKFNVQQVNSKEYVEKAKSDKGKLFWAGIEEPIISFSDDTNKKLFATYGLDSNNILALEINTNSFNDLIPSSQDIFKDQYIIVLDKKSEIIACNKVINNELLELVKNSNRTDTIQRFDLKEEEMYSKNQYNGLTGWKTFAFISNDRIFADENILKDFIVLFVLISIIIFSIMAYIISYNLTKPLEKLSNAMKDAEKYNYKNTITINRTDELGELTNSFNSLINKINKLVNEIYLGKITQKNAEIEALQSQINPHFLYNTLDSINWMLIDKEEYEISNIIISLGDILKYSMNLEDSIVTLEKEIENIKSYLNIQKNRFEYKLTYSIDIPYEILRVNVPKLILQPIVENSIIHGVDSENYDLSVHIVIHAFIKKDNLIIEIKDNGIGIKKNKLEKLKKYLTMENIGEEFNSIGLKNVSRRIQLYYGEEYGLRISSIHELGTIVQVIIPKGDEVDGFNNN